MTIVLVGLSIAIMLVALVVIYNLKVLGDFEERLYKVEDKVVSLEVYRRRKANLPRKKV